MPIHSYSPDGGSTTKLFSSAEVSKDLNSDSQSDRLTIATDLLGQNFNELMQSMHLASIDQDTQKCREILAVVQDKYPEQVPLAFNEYVDGVSAPKTSQASCSMLTRNKTSVQDLCGHLMIPASQVVVDDQGHCRRKSLAAFDASCDVGGTSIATSRISLT